MNIRILSMVLAMVLIPTLVFAHFMVIQTGDNIVEDKAKSEVVVDARFGHPFSQGLMDNDMPTRFGVLAGGKTIDLKPAIKTIKQGEFRTYQASYKIKSPGDHVFFIEPAPYWEPSENAFIIHYTKTIVHAFGLEEGWDTMVGFPIEIKPMTRPYGLWEGNLFTGQVLLNGKPLPHAEIEVAYDNKGGALKARSELFNIQVVMADENGVFHYAMPKAGWWGFAALAESDVKKKGPDGEEKTVEIGGLIWVYADKIK